MRAAALAFAVSVAGALALGETFPWSRYDMYASVGDRREGAVPVLLADGAPTDVRALREFSGLDPEALLPPGIPCSQEYVVNDIRAWVRSHSAPAGSPPGPVRVEMAYRLLRIEPDGALSERLIVVASGTARR